MYKNICYLQSLIVRKTHILCTKFYSKFKNIYYVLIEVVPDQIEHVNVILSDQPFIQSFLDCNSTQKGDGFGIFKITILIQSSSNENVLIL